MSLTVLFDVPLKYGKNSHSVYESFLCQWETCKSVKPTQFLSLPEAEKLWPEFLHPETVPQLVVVMPQVGHESLHHGPDATLTVIQRANEEVTYLTHQGNETPETICLGIF